MRFRTGDATFIVLADIPASVPALVVVLTRVDTGVSTYRVLARIDPGVSAYRVLARIDTGVLTLIALTRSVTAIPSEMIRRFEKLSITELSHECSL
jgi:hypothetical protein